MSSKSEILLINPGADRIDKVVSSNSVAEELSDLSVLIWVIHLTGMMLKRAGIVLAMVQDLTIMAKESAGRLPEI